MDRDQNEGKVIEEQRVCLRIKDLERVRLKIKRIFSHSREIMDNSTYRTPAGIAYDIHQLARSLWVDFEGMTNPTRLPAKGAEEITTDPQSHP